MSGIPRPVDDLPPGAVSVRVVRGQLTNNVANQRVDLSVDGAVQSAQTDAEGRAQFSGFKPGATLKASTEVDGERIESQEFPSPAQGGIRLLLVASGGGAAEAPAVPAVAGQVVIGGNSRIIMEPAEDLVRVYYLFDIVNSASTPVNPPQPFAFDTPSGAQGTTVMEGSTPQAKAFERHVNVQGPFAPGTTYLQVAYGLPSASGSVDIEQVFPATLEHVAVIVKKVGDAKLESPQIDRQQDMPADGSIYIAGAGERAVTAGQPLTLSISGLPHHSPVPRWTALILALGIAAAGAWAASRQVDPERRATERKQLIARREKLLQQLIRLELDQRRGRLEQGRYTSRRDELVGALEHVYGALDSDDTSPETGLAA
jgi:hypothetical protein